MANVGLHSGILMHKGKQLELPSHIDMTHVALLEGPKDHTHLGTLDLWAFRRKADVPFLSLAGIGSNNIIYTEDNFFTYDVAAASDQSICIVNDISGQAEVGKGGSEFEILVNSKRLGGHGQVFKFDNMLKEELMVTEKPIRLVGTDNGHYVYTVKRVDSDEPLNKLFLEPGTKLIPSHTEMSEEFGQDYASFAVKTPKKNTYIVPVGQVVNQVHYHITTKAAEYGGTGTISVPASTKAALDDAFEYYFNMSGVDAVGMTTFEDAVRNQPDAVANAMREGRVSVALSTMYDSLALKFLARNQESYMLWGTGGKRNMGGLDEYLAPVGAWQQFDTGYKTTFNLNSVTLDTFKAALTEYFHDKVDYPIPGNEPTLDVQTGTGGFQLANKWITEQANSQAFIVGPKDFNNITGNTFNLGYQQSWFTSIRIPMLANLRFIHTPALDQTHANDLINPLMPTGHRLSSYSFIIYAENEFGGSSNIKLVRSKEAGGKTFMNIINGTSSHPMTRREMNIAGTAVTQSQGADLKTGYSAYFRQKMDSLFVMDPTRILKLVPIHPKTGKTF